MSSVPLISGRGQPYQEKQETAEYRVLHSPSVVVRDRPWGSVIGSVQSGDVVKVTHRTIGLNDSVWVKTQEAFGSDGLLGFGASQKETGWMLVDGRCMNLPLLLDKVERRKGIVTRYRVVVDEADIRERPSLAGTPIVGRRKKGAILRTDQELNGWVRLQADFYVTGKAEPVEGWSLISGQSMGMGPILARWEPVQAPAFAIGSFGAQGGQTSRYWVVVAEGTAVRERPWGRVLCTRGRGMLLRVDTEKDGWARLEADFTEEGPLEAVDDGDEEASPLLEGWVLMDGRDLGLPRQLQKRAGEKVPPQEEPRRSDDERRSRSQTKLMAHVARGDDCSLGALLSEAKVSDEVASQLAEAGVDDFEALITTVSRGDHHQELRRCGIGKLGARAKLATLVQPYWKALAIKEQGNTSYKQSRFEEAARMYTRAIELVTGTSSTAAAAVDISDASSSSSAATTTTRSSSSAGGGPSAGSRAAKAAASTDLALNLYSNRAACFQQMREPKLALADVRHVLTFDPSNAKALARKTVYEGQLAAET